MAKRSRARRDASAIASSAAGLPLERFLGVSPLASPRRLLTGSSLVNLLELEDRRTFYPSGSPMDWEPARSLSGGPTRLQAPPIRSRQGRSTFPASFSPLVGFQAPRQVVVCVRRHQRKEVLFAKGFHGKRRLRKPTRSVYSSISCRRY